MAKTSWLSKWGKRAAAVTAILVCLGGLWLWGKDAIVTAFNGYQLRADVQKHLAEDKGFHQTVDDAVIRIKTLEKADAEQQQVAIRQQEVNGDIQKRLSRIEGKVDALLEIQGRSGKAQVDTGRVSEYVVTSSSN